MPKGGVLSIMTRIRSIDAAFCESSSFELEPGVFLEISVEDEGDGIEPHIQAHIFEPFFTTKPEGKGTGLGLASTYGAVKDHGGEIRVYSEKGHGTVFRILLPLHREHRNKKIPATEMSIPGGSARILVVDDEQYVRKTTRLILESLGYEVVLAEFAESALSLLEGEPKSADLALIDMVMPGMSGEELFYRLRDKWREMPLVLMSGFTKEANVTAMYAAGLKAFVRKPFTRVELGLAIAEALNSRAGEGSRTETEI
jgi:CheY-like chemotaxis protein